MQFSKKLNAWTKKKHFCFVPRLLSQKEDKLNNKKKKIKEHSSIHNDEHADADADADRT